MENPYDLVTEPPTYLQDKPMIDRLMELLKDTRQPLYVQMHMLGTHGATFEPRQQVFSNGQDILTQGKFSTDFFDDSILDMDAYLGTIIEKLRGSNLLDSTIIIVGSDHSQRTTPAIQRIMTSVRIPLLIRFPKGAHAGRININIQNMDVTPTILDYLGLNKPDWMKGQSILQTISPNRPIFAVTASGKDRETGPIALNPEKIKPPFYQFGSVSAVVCDSWYLLDLKNFEWLSGKVSGSTTSCTPQDQVNDERAYKMMVNHLKDNGFDTSSLESITPYLIQNDNAQP
jgi:hypothetical protein